MAEAESSSRRVKIAGVTVAAALVVLFVALQVIGMISSRPKVVREPVRNAIERFGIERASDPRLAAPPIELAGLDGARVSLADARGQVVFVNFWATWCPPCRDEMPSMLALAQDLASRYPGRFKMIAVTVDEDLGEVRSYFAAPPFEGPPGSMTIAHDADQKVTRAYYQQARGFAPDIKFPETYIVDKSGRLVAYVVGPRDWSDPAARAFLEALIRS
ncbi:MAG TPA: redoxin family protein [Anaeromyxobacter sp.]|nr:redoxin family protein [Anaeromyxobacter sp.]